MTVKLYQTEASRDVLNRIRDSTEAEQDLIAQASTWVSEEIVPWDVLHSACRCIREEGQDESDGPWLHKVAGGLALEAPPPRQRSPQLVARLAQLQAQLDAKQYAAMVADVTVEERAAQEALEGGPGSYRQQLSYAAHVIVMMGAGYGLGHVAGGALHPSIAYRAGGGLVGMVAALLLETALLVLRTGFQEPGSQQKRRHGASRESLAPAHTTEQEKKAQ